MPAHKYTPEEVTDAFWSRLDKAGPTQPHMDTPCWVWTAGTREGYGRFRGRGAHVFAFEMVNGPVHKGMQVNHECDNRLCVRQDHLHLGTPAANSAEMAARGRAASGDANGSRLHPDRLVRGDAHPARLHPERLARGAAHGCAKLTVADVLAIRAAHEAGESQHSLSRRYPVARSTIREVVRRQSWTDV